MKFRMHFRAAIWVIVLCVFVALLWFCPDPNLDSARIGLRPSPQQILGTDYLGRDGVSLSVVAARSALLGCGSAVFAGTILGLLFAMGSSTGASRFSQTAVHFAEKLFDMVGSLFPVAAILTVYPKLPLPVIGMMIGLLASPAISVPVRGVIQRLWKAEYILAARCLGMGRRRLFTHHMSAEIWEVLRPSMVALGGAALLVLTSLQFLGLASSSSVSLGSLAYESASHVRQTPWASLAPLLSYGLLLTLIFGLSRLGLVYIGSHRSSRS